MSVLSARWRVLTQIRTPDDECGFLLHLLVSSGDVRQLAATQDLHKRIVRRSSLCDMSRIGVELLGRQEKGRLERAGGLCSGEPAPAGRCGRLPHSLLVDLVCGLFQ